MTPLTSYESQSNRVGVNMSACIHHHLPSLHSQAMKGPVQQGGSEHVSMHPPPSAMTPLTPYDPQSNRVGVNMSACIHHHLP
ncbi:hypothetical protein M404DRAFT_820905 [Pisolithus tinctorius Marx 270]|uniref:Uncharacterized protein n=1 Tax=Pisolithus tinctorius Marx 270 TaxID=870435 RepID=A0A0C3IQQ1_PISTI|nr:hypothetical protein M404DRAFT_820905 [Pisolithus tinctorius Marx 270]